MLVRLLVRHERLAGSLGRLPSVLVSEIPAGQPLWERLGSESFDLLVVDGQSLPRPVARAIAAIRALPDSPEVIVAGDDLDAPAQARLLTAGALAVVHPRLGESALVREIGTLVERVRERKLAGLEASLGERPERLAAMESASPAMRHLLEVAARVARTDTTVLLLGETGAGKEWLARGIHEQGPRSAGPFLAVNCGAIPESLLESELFGHEEGAVRAHRGHFELAHGGTLFLDEVAEMPPHVQVKLLRVLQERSIRRVGGEREIGTDVRILAATNRDLEQEMRLGRFRADLFYRLGVVTITIPPLRDRREDIPRLVGEQIERFRGQLGHEVRGPSRAALDALTAYEWPGNVRELVNVVERALILCTGDEIGTADLPNLVPAGEAALPEGSPGDASADPGPFGAEAWETPLPGAREGIVERFEREYLTRALRRAGGRVRQAARRAGISERALYGKMRRYGLRKEDFRDR
jgi:DNA-binding NtrC family response regulator